MSFDLSNGGYHSKNNRNESNNKKKKKDIYNDGDSVDSPSATMVIASSYNNSRHGPPDGSSCFKNIEKIRSTKRNDNFEQYGIDEDFGFMSNMMDLTEEMTYDLNDTVTPPSGGVPSARRDFGKAGRVMDKHKIDPLEIAQLQQQGIPIPTGSNQARKQQSLLHHMGPLKAASMSCHRTRERTEYGINRGPMTYKKNHPRPSLLSYRPQNNTFYSSLNQRSTSSAVENPKRSTAAQHEGTWQPREDDEIIPMNVEILYGGNNNDKHKQIDNSRDMKRSNSKAFNTEIFDVDISVSNENIERNTNNRNDNNDNNNKNSNPNEDFNKKSENPPALSFTRVKDYVTIPRKKRSPAPIIPGQSFLTSRDNTPTTARHPYNNQPKLSHDGHHRQQSFGIPPKKFHNADNKPKTSMLEEISSALVTSGINVLNYVADRAVQVFTTPPNNNKAVPVFSTMPDNKRITRSSSKPGNKNHDNSVVVIDDSDDEYSEEKRTKDEQLNDGEVKKKRKFGELLRIGLSRIAIGKQVYSHRCMIRFQTGKDPPCVILHFAESTDNLTAKELRIPLEFDCFREMKYSLDIEDNDYHATTTMTEQAITSFIAMKLAIPDGYLTSSNRFPRNTNNSNNTRYLDQVREYGKFESRNEMCQSYIACEMRNGAELKDILHQMRESNYVLRSFLATESNVRAAEEASKYISVLQQHYELDRAARLSSSPRPKSRRYSTRLGMSSSSTLSVEERQKTLLVYPFIGGDRIEKVADGLKIFTLKDEKELISEEQIIQLQQEATTGRAHFLTITREDRERLEPGEFLNDTLVDFWMRWEEGVNAISSWTSKKGIDIFTKRIIFVPINQSLHWSLCAVINPGSIEDFEQIRCALKEERVDDDQRDQIQGMDVPCIIFLDSLKAHQKMVVASNIRKWLNHEWKKINKVETDIFTSESMKVYAPTVPYQNNSWDCGVFVCQYAYALYQKRDRKISFQDLSSRKPLMDAVTNNPDMNFDMDRIANLREHMAMLVDNLSVVYLEIKGEMKETKPKAKETLNPTGED